MYGPSTITIEQALIGGLLYYPEFRGKLATCFDPGAETPMEVRLQVRPRQ